MAIKEPEQWFIDISLTYLTRGIWSGNNGMCVGERTAGFCDLECPGCQLMSLLIKKSFGTIETRLINKEGTVRPEFFIKRG